MKCLGVFETRGDDKFSGAVDEPRVAVLPRRGAALRKLPHELECRRNDYATGGVGEPMFPVGRDAKQTALGTQSTRTRLLRAYSNREKRRREESRVKGDACHETSP